MSDIRVSVECDTDHPLIQAAIRDLVDARASSRLCAGDASLWGPAAEPEASIRLGWVDPFSQAVELIREASELRDSLHAQGIDRVVLCGMGGSSLGPEVIARWAGVPLTLLDSTHPNSVRRVLASDLERTVVVVSSKSGTTVETRSHLAAFEQAFLELGIPAAERIVAVTDPGSALESYARSAGYRLFLADPNVGGRFSVLTAFGIVPTVLAGVDMGIVVQQAASVHERLAADDTENPAVRLAARVFGQLPERYVLAIAENPSARWGLGDWIEQLVAESTGKEGKGVLPITLAPDAPELTGTAPACTTIVRVSGIAGEHTVAKDEIGVTGELGAQFYLWEVATALLGHLMNIDPFSQPDVESAKIAARRALADAEGPAVANQGQHSPARLIEELRQAVPPNGYLVIQAFLDRDLESMRTLETLRSELERNLEVPVAVGFGPRYLHSTGQFHKGGPKLGAFLQVADAEVADLPIPGSPTTFGELLRSQARGDQEVLRAHGRTVLTVTTPSLRTSVAEMVEALSR